MPDAHDALRKFVRERHYEAALVGKATRRNLWSCTYYAAHRSEHSPSIFARQNLGDVCQGVLKHLQTFTPVSGVSAVLLVIQQMIGDHPLHVRPKADPDQQMLEAMGEKRQALQRTPVSPYQHWYMSTKESSVGRMLDEGRELTEYISYLEMRSLFDKHMHRVLVCKFAALAVGMQPTGHVTCTCGS